jgi:hypothetical protein
MCLVVFHRRGDWRCRKLIEHLLGCHPGKVSGRVHHDAKVLPADLAYDRTRELPGGGKTDRTESVARHGCPSCESAVSAESTQRFCGTTTGWGGGLGGRGERATMMRSARGKGKLFSD